MSGFWCERDRFCGGPDRYLDISSHPRITGLIKELISSLEVISGSIKYLDVGCGDVVGTKLFANFLSGATGLMVEPVGIDIATSIEPDIQTLRIDLNSQRIPFKGNFHVVTIFETIEHIFNTDFLLESINNSVVKRGLLIITTLNVVCWKNRILVPLGVQPMNTEVSTKKLTYGYQFSFLKKHVSRWKPAGHIRPFTLNSLSELLEDNNFEIIHKFGLENWQVAKPLQVLAKGLCTGIGVLAVKR